MHFRILGSSAGGGMPQWNCDCKNCAISRRSGHSSNRRTQSSVAVNAGGKHWVLLNASPDLGTQIAAFPELGPLKGTLRSSSIDAVVLTDGEIDHIAGLLSIREQPNLRIVCTDAVRKLLSQDFPILKTLENYCSIRYFSFPFEIRSIMISAISLLGKNPRYAKGSETEDSVVGLQITSNKKKMAYIPCLPAITEKVRKFVDGCDCLLVDGTFWSDNELASLKIKKPTAKQMGHVPIHGKNGSLEWLRKLDIPKKVYIHINNTNPVLWKTSVQRKQVGEAGIEISYDGMEVFL